MNYSAHPSIDHSWVEVNLANLQQNASCIYKHCGHESARLLVVLKANAYGLGAIEIANALEDTVAVWGFAVATAEEGRELRVAGIQRPILVLRPATHGALETCRTFDLRPTIERYELACDWNRPFHIEIDTGMSRSGIRWKDRDELSKMARLNPEGVFTHFHSADVSTTSIESQMQRFNETLSSFDTRPKFLHVCNSAAVWKLNAPLDLIRPGIFLYGGNPGIHCPLPLPVVKLKAQIISTRCLEENDTVSYGADWTASQRTRIATIAIGYADGISRRIQEKGYVAIAGHACRIIGRITMDMLMVDISKVAASVQPGDIATIIGDDGELEISLEQFSSWSDTICYEVLTRLGNRLRRVYFF